MKLLIDADYIVYKSCATCEYEVDYGNDVIVVASSFSDAMATVERELTKLDYAIPFGGEKVLFFSGPENFRKKIFSTGFGVARAHVRACASAKMVLTKVEPKIKLKLMSQ